MNLLYEKGGRGRGRKGVVWTPEKRRKCGRERIVKSRGKRAVIVLSLGKEEREGEPPKGKPTGRRSGNTQQKVSHAVVERRTCQIFSARGGEKG